MTIFELPWIKRLATDLESAILFLKSLDMFFALTHRVKEAYDWSMRILANTDTWPTGKMRAMALWNRR